MPTRVIWAESGHLPRRYIHPAHGGNGAILALGTQAQILPKQASLARTGVRMHPTVAPGTVSARVARIVELVACPHCGDASFRVDNGSLVCTCGRSYPLRGDVPDFSGAEIDSVEGFQFQWEQRRAGTFETDTLYGKTAADEEEQFYRYLGIDRSEATGKLVLDAGCGSGRLLLMLSMRGVAAVGIDLTSTVFAIDQHAQSRGLETLLLRGNLRAIPLRADTFDYIWSGGVIHHTGNTREALRNLVRVLKPGGTLYVWVYSADQRIFGRMRQLLPFAHHLPKPILLGMCRALALPVHLLGLLMGRYHSMAEIRFKLFDHLAPSYRTVHTEAEMRSWFEAEGLDQIDIVIPQSTGGIGIRGRKRVSAARPVQ